MADAGALIVLCASSALVDGGIGHRFDVLEDDAPVGAFVVRHRGEVVGYLNRCAHVATELDWLQGQFFDSEASLLICATHGAVYEPASGVCVGGPCAGRGGLRKLAVHECDGVVYWLPQPPLEPAASIR